MKLSIDRFLDRIRASCGLVQGREGGDPLKFKETSRIENLISKV